MTKPTEPKKPKTRSPESQIAAVARELRRIDEAMKANKLRFEKRELELGAEHADLHDATENDVWVAALKLNEMVKK